MTIPHTKLMQIADEQIDWIVEKADSSREAGRLALLSILMAVQNTAVLKDRLTADEIYRVMVAWEKEPASDEQTRIIIKLGHLRDAAIAAGDSHFVTPLNQPIPQVKS